jgi:hypothetical protein
MLCQDNRARNKPPHAAKGMADNRRVLDVQVIEKPFCGAGEKIEMIANIGLGRFAEAKLIGNDDAIALARQSMCGRPPIVAGKAFAVQQHDCLAVNGNARRHIHIGHAQHLPLNGEIEKFYRKRIIELFEPDAERF